MVAGQGNGSCGVTVGKGMGLWGGEVGTGEVVAGVMRGAVSRIFEGKKGGEVERNRWGKAGLY